MFHASSILLLVSLIVLPINPLQAVDPAPAAPDDLARFVNPFIGTDRSGNTFPGSVSPFGSVQLTPNLAGNGYYYLPRDHLAGGSNHVIATGILQLIAACKS